MSAYWVKLVRTGDPNASDLPVRPMVGQVPEQVGEFGEGSASAPRSRLDVIAFWVDYGGLIR